MIKMTYKKPTVTVNEGVAEGVYMASGSTGTLNVSYYGVWDRWGTGGGKGLAMASWSDIEGTITLNITFMTQLMMLRPIMLLCRRRYQENLLHLLSIVRQIIL